MTDSKERLRALDRVPIPDVWERATKFEPRKDVDEAVAGHRRPSRVMAAIVAFAVFIAAGIFLLASLGTTDRSLPRAPTARAIAFVDAHLRIALMRPDGSDIRELTTGTEDDSYAVRYGYSQDLNPQWAADGRELYFLRRYGESVYSLCAVSDSGAGFRVVVRRFPAGLFAISPSGTQIAYGSGSGIFVMGIDGTARRQVVRFPHLPNGVPIAWSPDGKNVAFVSGKDQLWKVDEATGMLQRLTPAAALVTQATWSPDGSSIAYGLMKGSDGNGFPRSSQVWTIGPDGLGARKLTEDGYWTPVSWSPDGSELLLGRLTSTLKDDGLAIIDVQGASIQFINKNALSSFGSWRAGQPAPSSSETPSTTQGGLATERLAVVDLGGSTERIVLVNGDGSGLTSLVEGRDPSWSPDGTQISLRTGDADRPGGNSTSISVIDTDGRHLHALDIPEGVGGETSGDAGPAVWSPDGSHIAFATVLGIYVMRPDGSDLHRISRYEGQMACYDLEPTWSPDGQRVLFADRCDGGEAGLSSVEADGTGRRQLLPISAQIRGAAYPVFSPDGRHITFAGIDAANTWSIYVMDADGSDVAKVAGPSEAGFPSAWSPDGSLITFTPSGSGELDVVDVATRSVHVIDAGLAYLCCAAWQPVIIPAGS